MSKENSRKNSFFKLDLLILAALRAQDYYGYEIASIIKEQTDGLFVIREGVMYPILYRMVQDGFISSYDKVVKSRNRVYYHLEEAGEKHLQNMIGEFRQGMELVDKYLDWCSSQDGYLNPDPHPVHDDAHSRL